MGKRLVSYIVVALILTLLNFGSVWAYSFIDDSTGGDCESFGIWTQATKTCIFTSNLNTFYANTVDSPGITLDGNGYSVSPIHSRSGNVTIKNFVLVDAVRGFNVDFHNNFIINNTISTSSRYTTRSIYVSGDNNSIVGNIIYSNHQMLWVYGDNNFIGNNKLIEVTSQGLGVYGKNTTISGNTLLNSGQGDPREDVGIAASGTLHTIINNTVKGVDFGITIYGDENKILENNLLNNYRPIFILASDKNIIANNIISNNHIGLFITDTYWGYDFGPSNYNELYNNQFTDNTIQFSIIGTHTGNIFNLEKPIGGNYWSDFDTPAEGCVDSDGDGFCDNPYVLIGGQDDLPCVKPSCVIDGTPPITVINIPSPSGNNGWYTSDVEVTLTATDNGGSGVAQTEYSLDNVIWNIYSAPVVISSEGTTTLYYQSADNAGNIEETQSVTINIDKTAPEITINSPQAIDYSNSEIMAIDSTSVDSVSGIYQNTVRLDGVEYDPTIPLDLLYLSLGVHSLTVESENNAGLTSSSTVDFTVIATPDSTIDIIDRFLDEGEIENGGTATSLTQVLEAASAKIEAGKTAAARNMLEALINYVEAQRGTQISEEATDTIIAAAQYMLEQL